MSHGHSHEVDPHLHEVGVSDHCHLSAKYAEYIQIHLEDLKTKCLHLSVCINKLLSTQSPISVLKGQNLSLRKICRLINVKDNNSTEAMLDGKCSMKERIDIRTDMEMHLKNKLEKRESFEDVASCLENGYGDDERTTYVGDICGLAEKEDLICKNYHAHQHVEKFFNDQIEHLQCTCKSLHRDTAPGHEHMSTPMIIGIGAGGFLLLCIIIGVALFCCWRRKKNKKKKRPNVIYLPSNNSDCPVYQEIYDQRSPPGHPPSLPRRYNSRPLPGQPPDDGEYLEPVTAGSNSYRSKAPPPLTRLVNNPGYSVEKPPEYSETDQMYEEAVLLPSGDQGYEQAVLIRPAEPNPYFEPIQTPKSGQGQGQSYDTLTRGESQDENTSAPDEYQLLEDVKDEDDHENDQFDTNKPLGPIPAKRTKKEDRSTESEYFELETEGESLETEIN